MAQFKHKTIQIIGHNSSFVTSTGLEVIRSWLVLKTWELGATLFGKRYPSANHTVLSYHGIAAQNG
ncbi:MAG: hypothetical protein ABIN80_29205 [Dyadobacter sp.]|uniref:hypothetical protein n=1 Tax=Dyadobacter sp. TaxID=1914288 RepID=UPI0032639C63